MQETFRCPWAAGDPLYIAYHDNEWGRPCHDDRQWYEMLTLEGMQAGLSWLIILKKREALRAAFDGFDPQKVALYDEAKIDALMEDKGVVRNRRKISCAVTNARVFLEVQAKYGSFDAFIWNYVDGRPIDNPWKDMWGLQASTPLSDQISKDLKAMGFKYANTTTVYALMQATGLVNDHLADCFVRKEIERPGRV